jgi:hypothetical protein
MRYIYSTASHVLTRSLPGLTLGVLLFLSGCASTFVSNLYKHSEVKCEEHQGVVGFIVLKMNKTFAYKCGDGFEGQGTYDQ